MPSPPNLLMPEEAAAVLRVSLMRLYELARTGVVPSVRLGRSLRFDEMALQEFVQQGGSRQPSAANQA